MIADKSYFAVPTLTSLTIVRSRIREGREYTNQMTGQSIQRVETGGRRVDVALTTYQPVIRDGVVVRYTDLGDDEFSFPDVAPTMQAEAGGSPVTTMDELLDGSIIQSLRDVLVDVMTGSIPDFSAQPESMRVVGVPRYFHVDRIQFFGREDRAKEATLRVLLGVYADIDCTQLKKYIQQDFVSASVIAEKQKLVESATAQVATMTTEANASSTTEERKAMLQAQLSQLQSQIDEVSAELEDLQPLSLVVNKPAIKAALVSITEAVLTDAVTNRPQYANIDVETLMLKFDAAYAGLVAAIEKV